MPDNNSTAYLGHIVTWDHVSHLCLYECLEMTTSGHPTVQPRRGRLPEFPQAVYCYFNDCLPEDFERSFVLETIDDQKFYNRDGTLTTAYVTAVIMEECWEQKEVPSSDCVGYEISNHTRLVHYYNEIDDYLERLVFVGGLSGNPRPQLTQTQQAAKDKMQQFADQACDSVSKP